MADIIQEFIVKASPARVMEMFATPEGLDRWWTKQSAGVAQEGAEFTLYFGPEFDWRARVTRFVPDREFELHLTNAHEDWQGSRIGCTLNPEGQGATRAVFYHKGWPVRMNTGGSPATVGPCICGCFAATWNTAKSCPTKGGSRSSVPGDSAGFWLWTRAT